MKAGNNQINLLEFCVVGNFGEEKNTEIRIVDATNVVVQAVRYDEIVGMEHAVVRAYLGENFLRDANAGSFVFDNHTRVSSFAIEEHAVATALNAIDIEACFVAQESSGVVLVFNEVVGEMLSDPFFRG